MEYAVTAIYSNYGIYRKYSQEKRFTMDFDVKKEVKDFYGNIAKNVEIEEQSTCSCCKKPSRAERLYDWSELLKD